jgi:YVTN family beta-propeller protein
MSLDFRILGPLAVTDKGRAIPLGGGKQRALLALLLINRGDAVSSDRLIEELWAGRPPATAAKSVQVYVSQLRKATGPGVIVTRGGGYALLAEPDQVDANRFERLCEEGRRALDEGDPQQASSVLAKAHDLWRGTPLADFAYDDFAQSEINRLEESRLAALEDRIEADLALGRHAKLVGELEGLAREYPMRERFQRQLMLALYGSGRQGEALEHYRGARRRMVDEIGIEPSAAMQALEQQILNQDPALEAPPRPSIAQRTQVHGRDGRRVLLIALGGILLLAVAVAAAIRSDESGSAVEPNSVAVIDTESKHVLDQVAVGIRPDEIAAGEDAIWVANVDDASVSQIDPEDQTVVGTRSPGTSVDALAVGSSGVWVSDVMSSLAVHLDPEFRDVADRVRVPGPPTFARGLAPIAVGEGAVWIGNGSATVMKVDPASRSVTARIDVGNEPTAIAASRFGVWVADDTDNTVTRIDPETTAVTSTTPVGVGPTDVAVGEGAVWVANGDDGTVGRLDRKTGAVITTIAVGGHPTGIAVGDGAVWVASSDDGTVTRINPQSNEVEAIIEVGESPRSLVVADGRVWVTVQAAPPPAPPPAGGEDAEVLRVVGGEDTPPDPALPGDFQRAYETCLLLYNYPDAAAPEGANLRPEAARGSPGISDAGRTYTFEVRDGFRFSPPSDEQVTAASFARAIERVLDPRVGSYEADFIQDIVGARAYSAGKTHELPGVSVHGNELTIRLVAPAPDLLSRLSTPVFCAVPEVTPTKVTGDTVIPSAGPYYVDSYVPGQSLVLLRNPNYPGGRPAGFEEIDYEIGTSPGSALRAVEGGDADYFTNLEVTTTNPGEIPDSLKRLEEAYGPGSEAAEAGAQQLFVEPSLSLFLLSFNTQQPPFDDVRLRKAVNFALDRRALAGQPFAPGDVGRPTDQFIPPGMPGFRDAALYPLGGPNLARARARAGDVHEQVDFYTCNSPTCSQFAEILRQNLAAIGLAVEVHQFPVPKLFEHIFTPGEPFDIAQSGWTADYPDPETFTNQLFQGGGLAPIDDPAFERRMNKAARLTGQRRYETYAELDRDLATELVPAAPYANAVSISLFSSRIGCQVNQPIYGIDLGRLCVRD